jgi:hypothetical protein
VHRAIQRAFINCFQSEPRWQHLGLFGSLARGDWTRESDVDLNVVIADGANVSPVAEIERAGPALAAEGETLALVIPDGADSVNAMVHSLTGISVRFHSLASTNPNIVATLRTLVTRIDPGAVIAAGQANIARRQPPATLHQLVDNCLRDAVETAGAMRGSRQWMALELLARARSRLIALYAHSAGSERPLHFFEEHAPAALQARLRPCVALPSQEGLLASLYSLLDLVEFELNDWASGGFALTPDQLSVIRALRARLAVRCEQAALARPCDPPAS